MCIIHKGSRGFRALSPALILGSNLTGLKPANPYEILLQPLAIIIKNPAQQKPLNKTNIDNFKKVEKIISNLEEIFYILQYSYLTQIFPFDTQYAAFRYNYM